MKALKDNFIVHFSHVNGRKEKNL